MPNTPEANRLVELLRQHGIGGQPATGLAGWSAFKTFGREIFGRPGAGLLFQVGTFDFTGKPLFRFDPVCQIERIDQDGEHDHFEQLHCEMTCPPDSDTHGVSAELWSFGYDSADAFFAAVESLPAFRIAVRRTDYTISVTHEDV